MIWVLWMPALRTPVGNCTDGAVCSDMDAGVVRACRKKKKKQKKHKEERKEQFHINLDWAARHVRYFLRSEVADVLSTNSTNCLPYHMYYHWSRSFVACSQEKVVLLKRG